MSSTVTFPRTGPDARILIVDDEEPIRRSLVRLLDRVGFDCATAADATEARKLLTAEAFDLMLCDVTMPGESGFSLLAHAHDAHPELAVIMVTAVDSPGTTQPAVRDAAYSYVIKPFDTNMILINIVGALKERSERINEMNRNQSSGNDNSERIDEVTGLLDQLAEESLADSPATADTVRRVALAAEWRDVALEAAQHLERVGAHTARLATLAGLPPDKVERLRLASQLHDVGKVGIPDPIVLNSRLLTEDERLTMQGHTEAGFRMLMGSDSPLLKLGSIVALTHHERFDGNGYPNRLVSTAIPLEGRIVAIADVFDALRTARAYKHAYSLQESLAILRNRRRAQLDPELLDLFINDLEASAGRNALQERGAASC
jgi:putative two-component system response regulator